MTPRMSMRQAPTLPAKRFHYAIVVTFRDFRLMLNLFISLVAGVLVYSKNRRGVGPDDLILVDLETQETETILVILLKPQRVRELHRRFWPPAAHLVQLLKLRTPAIACHNVRNLEPVS